MAANQYTGVGGVARKIKAQYIGVNGVARKVKNGFVGVGGVARRCWSGDIVVQGSDVAVGTDGSVLYGRTIPAWSKVTGWITIKSVPVQTFSQGRYSGNIIFRDRTIYLTAYQSPYTAQLEYSYEDEDEDGEVYEVTYVISAGNISVGNLDVQISFSSNSFLAELGAIVYHGESSSGITVTGTKVSFNLTFTP